MPESFVKEKKNFFIAFFQGTGFIQLDFMHFHENFAAAKNSVH